ncbi:MAG: conjugal transfer protein TraF [Leptothrix sp. (in: b-proteobacteria)]
MKRISPSCSPAVARTLDLSIVPLACVAAIVSAWPAQANESLSASGYGLTVGPVYNRSNLGSAAYNPANALRLVADDEQVRLGVLEAGARYEIGPIDNVNKLKDDIKADIDLAKNATASEATRIANKINTTYLPQLAAGANGNVQAKASLLTPILVRTERLPGVWSFNANAQVQAGGMFRQSAVSPVVKFTTGSAAGLTANVDLNKILNSTALTDLQNATNAGDSAAQTAALNTLKGLVVGSTDQAAINQAIASINANPGQAIGATYSVTTASAIDFKVANVNQVSLGYSTDLTRYTPDSMQALLPSAKLDAGLRVNAYQALLYRQIGAFVDANGNSNTVKIESSRNNTTRSTALGLDVGAALGGDNYQVGATLYNLNSPSFKYPDLLLDSTNAANLAAARQLAAEGTIKTADSIRLKPHVVLEGSLSSANKRWLLQSSLALNATTDFVGAPQKHATVSISSNAEGYESAWLKYLVPSVRLGYNKNLVGSQLATVGLGLSWGVFNIDANVSQQSVTIDGNKAPRSAGLSMSIAEKF